MTTLSRTPPHRIGPSGRQRRRRRTAWTTGGLAVGAFALFVLTMMVGSYFVAPFDVIASAFRLKDDPAIDFIVRDLRLPTATAALAVGIALGVSGAVFQRLLRNPLASPDFVGVSSGASLFAVSSIVLFNAGSAVISGSAMIGALLASLTIYLLAWRDGVTGYRFILIGIGVSQLMLSVIAYVLSRAQIYEAQEAMTWLVGSVRQAGSGELRLLLVVLLVLVPIAALLDRPMRTLELGDDTAAALGSRVEPTKIALLAVAIVLIGSSTAVAGPIMFVALIAGPIAVRIAGPGSGVVAAGLVGGLIVLGADLVSQQLLPVALPTGVVTGIVGAPYLIWLLATVNREGRGG